MYPRGTWLSPWGFVASFLARQDSSCARSDWTCAREGRERGTEPREEVAAWKEQRGKASPTAKASQEGRRWTHSPPEVDLCLGMLSSDRHRRCSSPELRGEAQKGGSKRKSAPQNAALRKLCGWPRSSAEPPAAGEAQRPRECTTRSQLSERTDALTSFLSASLRSPPWLPLPWFSSAVRGTRRESFKGRRSSSSHFFSISSLSRARCSSESGVGGRSSSPALRDESPPRPSALGTPLSGLSNHLRLSSERRARSRSRSSWCLGARSEPLKLPLVLGGEPWLGGSCCKGDSST